MNHDRMPSLLAEAMGNEFYIARFHTKKEMNDFVRFVYARARKGKNV